MSTRYAWEILDNAAISITHIEGADNERRAAIYRAKTSAGIQTALHFVSGARLLADLKSEGTGIWSQKGLKYIVTHANTFPIWETDHLYTKRLKDFIRLCELETGRS